MLKRVEGGSMVSTFFAYAHLRIPLARYEQDLLIFRPKPLDGR
jgi:hypothetical protein